MSTTRHLTGRRAAALAHLTLAPLWIALATARAWAGDADADRLGEAPHDPWRTIETERFVVHYPLAAEAWALEAAGRLEGWRDRVTAAVGNDLRRKVTVVIRDPWSDANGSAYPFLRSPRTELWISPPDSASEIGWNRRWDEGLMVHEDTHLVHLGRPSRGGPDKLLDAAVGVGPVARKVPRWVAEGYATVVEGDETGFGRPFSAPLAADLRRLATEGAMPLYGELDGSARWRGGGFAYGIGASYLRWLRDRAGPDSLRHLWIRLAAVEARSFEHAFEGVFGDTPDVLYGRFVAELTLDAMQLEATRPPEAGTRWLDLDGGTGWPDLSPDGGRMVLRADAGARGRLEVWTTKDEPTESTDDPSADPEDVPDPPPGEPNLSIEATRSRRDRDPSTPRWIDEDRVLFTGRQVDRSGRVRTDLYVWDTTRGGEKRLTYGQDIRDADPDPTGSFAVAVRLRWGASQLVRVNLATGAVEDLETASIRRVVDTPRLSPDGRRLLFLAMEDGGWNLFVGPLEGPWVPVPLPEGAQPTTPTWHPDGERVVLSIGTRAWMEIVEVDPATGAVGLWTNSHGGALAPVIGEEQFFWLDEDAKGRDIHAAPRPTVGRPPPPPDTVGRLAWVPEPPTIPLPTPRPVTARPYGAGPSEGRFLVSGAAAPGAQAGELVFRHGDPIGKREALIYAAAHRSALGEAVGARVSGSWRGAPALVEGDLYAARDPYSGTWIAGLYTQLRDSLTGPSGGVTWSVGALLQPSLSRLAPDGGSGRLVGSGQLGFEFREPAYRIYRLGCDLQGVGGEIAGHAGGWVAGTCRAGLFGFVHGSATAREALGSAPDLGFGGVRDAALPDVVQIDRIVDPAWSPVAAAARGARSWEARLGPEEGGLFLQGLALTRPGDPARWYTLAGFSGTGVIPRQPFLKLPEARATSGLACRLQRDGQGVERRPCTELSDWTVWGAITWTR